MSRSNQRTSASRWKKLPCTKWWTARSLTKNSSTTCNRILSQTVEHGGRSTVRLRIICANPVATHTKQTIFHGRVAKTSLPCNVQALQRKHEVRPPRPHDSFRTVHRSRAFAVLPRILERTARPLRNTETARHGSGHRDRS